MLSADRSIASSLIRECAGPGPRRQAAGAGRDQFETVGVDAGAAHDRGKRTAGLRIDGLGRCLSFGPTRHLKSSPGSMVSSRRSSTALRPEIIWRPSARRHLPSTPQELAAFQETDTKRWAEIVETAKIEKK